MSGHSKWANIKHKKGKMDAIRGKITTKISREITVAARMGGGDPTGNMRLKLALQKARENNIPKENIQRAIQKGVGGLDGSNYEEIIYEGYGPGGVAIMLDIMTDNRNRTAADIRHLFTKYGGNLGESGCVSWMFKKKGLFVITRDAAPDEDDLLAIVLEAGAEDMQSGDKEYEIITDPDDFEKVQTAMEGNRIEADTAQITMIPDNTITLTGEDADKMEKLWEALEEHDDVQEVYGNFELPDNITADD